MESDAYSSNIYANKPHDSNNIHSYCLGDILLLSLELSFGRARLRRDALNIQPRASLPFVVFFVPRSSRPVPVPPQN